MYHIEYNSNEHNDNDTVFVEYTVLLYDRDYNINNRRNLRYD